MRADAKVDSTLQAGFMKSGNFWLWTIIEAAHARAGIPRRSFLRSQPIYGVSKHWGLAFDGQGKIDMINILSDRQLYVIPPVFMWPIDDFDDYVRRCSHVWTHSDLMQGREKNFRKFSKIVFIIRDPRDVSLSVQRFDSNAFRRKFYGTVPGGPPEVALGWDANVESFLRHARSFRIHVVFYERLLHAWDSELDRLLAYLELDLDARGRRAIEGRTRLHEMKKKSGMHVAKGEAYGWARDLDHEQQVGITNVHEPMLRLLGYPMTAEEAKAMPLPTLPTSRALKQYFDGR